MTKYPLLTEMLHQFHIESYGSGKEKPESEWVWPSNAERLERLVSKMDADERLDYVSCDGDVINKLNQKYGLEELDDFLSKVVDGCYTKNFWILG